MPMIDLVGAMARAVAAGPAGEAGLPEFAAHGWSSLENRAAIFTIYRSGESRFALTAADVEDLLTVHRAMEEQEGGWLLAAVDADRPDLFRRVMTTLLVANREWWHHQLDRVEMLALHHYPPGTGFAPHVDRLPMTPDRVLNLVAMLQHAKAGGVLRLNMGGELIVPDLEPGDVVVFDAAVLHEVTPIRRGLRKTVVTHATRKPL